MSKLNELSKEKLVELALAMECQNNIGRYLTEEDLNKLTEARLIKLIDSTQQESDNEEEFCMQFEEPEKQKPETLSEVLPRYGSQEWQDFVISQFKDDEVFEGCPKSSALRRVAQELLGDVVIARADHVSVIPQNDVRAITVSYTVSISWKLDFNIASMDLNSGSFSDVRTFGGMADCIENPDNMFARHPAATAETKAMGRAYKNALALNIVTMEEKMSGYNEDPVGVMITEQIAKMIKTKCKALNLNVSDMLKEAGFDKPLTKLTDAESKAFFDFINTKQQN